MATAVSIKALKSPHPVEDIALRPLWDVTDLLRSGKLVNVLPNYAQLDSDVQWIAPFRSHLPRRVTLLREWLQDAFATPSWSE